MGAKKGEHRSPRTEFKPGHGFSLKYKSEYAEEMIKFFEESDVFPTFERYATAKRITSLTLREWAKKYPKFGAAYDVCLEIQKARNLEGGVCGAYNPQIVKFIATNCHGMSEKSEQKIDADVGGKGVTVNIVVDNE